MDPVAASLIGALIGAIAGIAGGWLSNWHQTRLEREKWLRGRSEDFAKDLRSSVKELTTTLANTMHGMAWLCWRAEYAPDRLGQADIDQYDAAMHKLLPRIFASHAVIAGMDEDVHGQLRPLVKSVIELDVAIGQASLEFIPGIPGSAAPLAEHLGSANRLENSLHDVVADSVRAYAVTPARSADMQLEGLQEQVNA
jgi:hypothetical protein